MTCFLMTKPKSKKSLSSSVKKFHINCDSVTLDLELKKITDYIQIFGQFNQLPIDDFI